jgi:hypothetical protein
VPAAGVTRRLVCVDHQAFDFSATIALEILRFRVEVLFSIKRHALMADNPAACVTGNGRSL